MEEAEACWIAEERVVAVVVTRRQAVLDVEAKGMAEVEEMGAENGSGSPLKQKEKAEGELFVCDHCVTQGAECQVIDSGLSFGFLLMMGR